MTETMNGHGMWGSGPIAMFIFVLLIIVPFWFIFSKAGHSKWLSLLMAVPFINVILLYFLAFSDWPNLSDKK